MFTTLQEASSQRARRKDGAMPARVTPGPPQPAVAQRRFSRSPCACGGGCPTCSAERRPIGQRAARDGAVVAAAAAPPVQVPVPAAPAFRDCTAGITGIPDANERLETARQRARGFVGAARRVLGAAPAAGTTYETALGRHFIAPTDANRATIADAYRQILGTLVVSNYICNSQNICEGDQAFWIREDGLVHVCRQFWELSPTCRAIILIHEGAHDIGIGLGAHPPYRGETQYPMGNVAPPAGETTARRMNNPDAYAFFAAHIWRGTDSGRACF